MHTSCVTNIVFLNSGVAWLYIRPNTNEPNKQRCTRRIGFEAILLPQNDADTCRLDRETAELQHRIEQIGAGWLESGIGELQQGLIPVVYHREWQLFLVHSLVAMRFVTGWGCLSLLCVIWSRSGAIHIVRVGRIDLQRLQRYLHCHSSVWKRLKWWIKNRSFFS